MKHENLEKEETKRFYEFEFEQLTKLLKLEGRFLDFGILDEDGVKSGLLKIITVVTEEKDDSK